MKKIIPIVVLLLAVGGYFAWSRMKGEDEGVLRLSGNIEFKKVDIAFKTAGKLVELSVDEGANGVASSAERIRAMPSASVGPPVTNTCFPSLPNARISSTK